MLSTGTGIVPDLDRDLTLAERDNLRLEIEDVGVLTNPVIRVPTRAAAG
jgi:hypothetical protein